MIVQELLIHDENRYIKTYSDSGMMIEQVETGVRYGEAIDPEQYPREYVETDEPIEQEEEEEEK